MSVPRIITRAVLTLGLSGIPLAAVADPVDYASASREHIWLANGHKSHFQVARETSDVPLRDAGPPIKSTWAAALTGGGTASLTGDDIGPFSAEETAEA